MNNPGLHSTKNEIVKMVQMLSKFTLPRQSTKLDISVL